ncbi:gastrula zinc finger protein XlCGF28.1-like [Silurus asotus]|uniref:Gastrula zinc finger protein XlCGF28.1-like n=1 Tax=Silurus asotus TaxID=30991 RepID=A0AAD5AL10_SILAS|nr:gastrula zinc finger protein XlCGF28.1-like [Silurus asotus]
MKRRSTNLQRESTTTSRTAETLGACGRASRRSRSTRRQHLPGALNDFYARFEVQNNVAARRTTPPPTDQVLCLTTAEVRKTLCRVNPRKSAGPDNIPGRVLRKCAEHLVDVFTDIFNISLSSKIVPTCHKTLTIVPMLKKSTVSCLNDYRPIALTHIVMKCFERLIMKHIETQLPSALDPMQLAYRPNRSTDDAISTTLDLALTHLDYKCTRAQSGHSSLIIDGSSVEIVKSTKFLGVYLADNLTWSLNTSSITKKAQQRLYFLRRMRKAHLPPPILTTFYRGTIESRCITAWFGNCTVSDRKTLQRIVRTTEKIIGVSLPSIMDIYTTHCIRKAQSIVEDHTHPSHTPVTHTPHTHPSHTPLTHTFHTHLSHTLFTILPSGKWFQSIRASHPDCVTAFSRKPSDSTQI